MMDEGEDFDFTKMISDAFPDRMITSWIIVAESITGDSKELHVATSDEMTTWLATGMLNCAGEIILNSGYSTSMGEEDE